MMSAREERKIKDTIARIERLEQEEREHHPVSTTRKRKRSAGHSSSPKHPESPSQSKSRQNSPQSKSPRKRSQNDNDADSEMSTDDDIDWLPPKLILVRRFFRSREKSLAKLTPESIPSEKAGTSEPVSPSDTDISSRKDSATAKEIKTERLYSPESSEPKQDFKTVKESRKHDPSEAYNSSGRKDSNGTQSSPEVRPKSPHASPGLKKKSLSPDPQTIQNRKPKPMSTSRSPVAEPKPAGPDLADLFSDVDEKKSVWNPEPEAALTPAPAPAPAPAPSPAPVAQPAIQVPPVTPAPAKQRPEPPAINDRVQSAPSVTPSQPPLSIATNVTVLPTPQSQPTPIATPNGSNPMQSPFALSSPSPVTPTNPPPPKPVKKLSFADYRKKQMPAAAKEKDKVEEAKKE